jgi:hypothetical protein
MLKTNLIFLLCLLVASAAAANAQATRVRFRLEIGGKQVESHPKIILYAGDKEIQAPVVGHTFTVPPEVEKLQKVNVRFLTGKYDLFFESVYLSKFEGEWIIGVDKKPFDKENLASAQPRRQIRGIHYINFSPTTGDGTRMVVISYKN